MQANSQQHWAAWRWTAVTIEESKKIFTFPHMKMEKAVAAALLPLFLKLECCFGFFFQIKAKGEKKLHCLHFCFLYILNSKIKFT